MQDFWYEYGDYIKIIFIASLIFCILFFGLYMLGIKCEKKSCYKIAKTLNYKCEYSIWTGCVLTDKNNKKFLLEQLRQVK